MPTYEESPRVKSYHKDKADLRDVMSLHDQEDRVEYLLHFIAKQLIEIKYEVKNEQKV